MNDRKDLLDRLLDPVGRALGQEAAKRIVALRSDPVTQSRIDELADRANDGMLTSEERAEYESLVAVGEMIALLQEKARVILASPSAA